MYFFIMLSLIIFCVLKYFFYLFDLCGLVEVKKVKYRNSCVKCGDDVCVYCFSFGI